MFIDKTKLSRKEIIKKPGELSARIIYNNLLENDYAIVIISDASGGNFYHVTIGDVKAVVAFTSVDIAIANLNRDHIRQGIFSMFKKNIFLIETNLLHLSTMREQRQYLDNAIINPTGSDFFIPIKLSDISVLMSNNKIIYSPEIHSDYNITRMIYNKESKSYEFLEESFDIGD